MGINEIIMYIMMFFMLIAAVDRILLIRHEINTGFPVR